MQKYIAIIDDDEDDVRMLTQCFEKYHSISIKGFFSAQQFLDASLNDSLPCLLVVDLNLPDIRGIDLINEIKLKPLLEQIPIIVYTTSYTPRDQVSCKDLKITLLKKPDTVLEWDRIALLMAQHCDSHL